MAKGSKKETRTKYGVTPVEFVRVWTESETLEEVVKKLGMPKDIVSARASKYRGDGIELKRMKPAGRADQKLDVDYLNRLIKEITAAKEKKPG